MTSLARSSGERTHLQRNSDTTAWNFSSSDSSVVYSITGLPENVNENNIDRKVFYEAALAAEKLGK